MDSVTPHVPAPSVAWGRLAASHGELVLADASRQSSSGPDHPHEDAAQLRARLLRMIVDSEQSRKAAAAEGFHAR